MKVRTRVFLAWMALLMCAAPLAASSALEKLGLPPLPDATLTTEIDLPPGALLDTLARDYGPWLGITSLSRINGLIFGLSSRTASQDLYKLFDPAITQQNWKTMVRSFDNGKAVAVLYSEQSGFLIINIEKPGPDRHATIIRLFGTMDSTKVANPEGKLADLFQRVIESAAPGAGNSSVKAASQIPVGMPISVAPSQKLHVQTARSAVNAVMLDRPTVQVKPASRTDDPGELLRVEDRLVLSISPKLDISELLLPGSYPTLLELTEGSLDLECGPGPNDRPTRLNINSTGALLNIRSFALVSGTHAIKSVGGEVRMSLSSAQGGVLSVEATGRNLTFALPKSSSARVQAFTTSGKIDNETGLTPEESGPDHLGLKFGSGNADITLRAINGNITLRRSE